MTDTFRSSAPGDPADPGASAIFTDPAAADPAVRQVLMRLRGYVPATAPEPSVELLATLAALRQPAVPALHAVQPLTRRQQARSRTRKYHKAILTVASAAAVAIPATGVAAANNQLPPPAEQVVTRVVNDWTPFSISTDIAPPVHRPAPRTPSPAAPVSSTPGRSGQPGQPAPPSQQQEFEPVGSPSPEPAETSRPSLSPSETEPADPRSGEDGSGSPTSRATASPSQTADR